MAIGAYLINWAWHTEGIVPPAMLKNSAIHTALQCIVFTVLLQIPLIFLVSLTRVLTKRTNTFLGNESPFLTVQIAITNNNTENAFVFSMNLLAYAALADPRPERIILLTAVFMVLRVLFIIGYELMLLTGLCTLRGLGFAGNL
jgi:hypothetical protein